MSDLDPNLSVFSLEIRPNTPKWWRCSRLSTISQKCQENQLQITWRAIKHHRALAIQHKSHNCLPILTLHKPAAITYFNREGQKKSQILQQQNLASEEGDEKLIIAQRTTSNPVLS